MLTIYFSKIHGDFSENNIFPKARQDEISSIKNEVVKQHKIFVWRLLEYALSDIGLKLENAKITKLECGKWSSPYIFFSLSHTDGVAAVAVSDTTVGIDIETTDSLPKSNSFMKRILTESELSECGDLSDTDELLSIWTAKEAVFKTLSQDAFIPSEIELKDYNVHSDFLIIDNKKYVYSVAAADFAEMKIKTLEI